MAADKVKRAERMVALTQVLMAKPNVLIPLTTLAERFGTAKSTISEDLLSVRESLRLSYQGRLETLPGAAGGVRYVPEISEREAGLVLHELALKLSSPERIVAGAFLYMTDLLFNPAVLRPLGLIFAGAFRQHKPDAIVTVETKGIPLALVTAEALGLPMVVVRHGNKVTEGSSVSINYLSGSSGRIQTMSLSRRALDPGTKVLLIDDFMKAGSTARALINLMTEFEATVAGIGVLMETALTREPKLVEDYLALLRLEEFDPVSGITVVRPVPSQVEGQ